MKMSFIFSPIPDRIVFFSIFILQTRSTEEKKKQKKVLQS